MPIYRPKSVNNILAALTVTTLTIAGLALFNDRLWVKSDTTGNIVQVGNAGDSARYLTVSSTSTSVSPWLRVLDGLTPTQNMFEVSNSTEAKKYLTVSSTATNIMGHSGLVSLIIGTTTDNGNNLTIKGDNAYLTSETNKALVFAAPGSGNVMYFSVGGINRFVVNGTGLASFGGSISPNALLNVSRNSYTNNLFEINDANTNGVYTGRYFTVSSTSTTINNSFLTSGVVLTTNTSYTVSATDTVVAMRGTVARTVTMAACSATSIGRTVYIDDAGQVAGTANITINRAGSDTIDGATSYTISTNSGVLRAICVATNRWYSF